MDHSNLPPAAKLAALIEAGRAANPNLKQCRNAYFIEGSACALGFACLGTGLVSHADMMARGGAFLDESENPLMPWASAALRQGVAFLNDRGAPLSEILQSLREGAFEELPA